MCNKQGTVALLSVQSASKNCDNHGKDCERLADDNDDYIESLKKVKL